MTGGELLLDADAGGAPELRKFAISTRLRGRKR